MQIWQSDTGLGRSSILCRSLVNAVEECFQLGSCKTFLFLNSAVAFSSVI